MTIQVTIIASIRVRVDSNTISNRSRFEASGCSNFPSLFPSPPLGAGEFLSFPLPGAGLVGLHVVFAVVVVYKGVRVAIEESRVAEHVPGH